jgi:microcin C transport system ATP-binding protein
VARSAMLVSPRPRRAMQVVFQDPFGALSPRKSIAQIVGEGLGVHEIGATPAERRDLVDEAQREVGLDPAQARHRLAYLFISTISRWSAR